jgi:hypothetical protein
LSVLFPQMNGEDARHDAEDFRSKSDISRTRPSRSASAPRCRARYVLDARGERERVASEIHFRSEISWN